MKMKTNFFYFFGLLKTLTVFSQTGEVTNHIFDGNKKADAEAYVEAEKSYRKALSLAPEKVEALYNLGNTHFLDKQYDEASQRFFQTQKFAKSKDSKHRAFHNMGNVYMLKKEYQKAVEAYKNALRNNPADEETRYNYALAKELLENETPPQEKEQDNNKDQKDKKNQENQEDKDQKGDQKDKEEKNQEKKGDQGDKSAKDGEPKNEGDKNEDQKQNKTEEAPQDKRQETKQGKLSPQQVQSLLEAMNNQEKKVQDKVKAKKVKGVPVRGKKDW